MMGLGWQELTIILVIVVIIFGAGKLPEIGSGLGKGIRGFKEESGLGDDDKKNSGDAIESGSSQTSTTLTASARDSREKVAEEIDAEKRERSIRPDEI
ncbi:MAG TPA: twin-arginine translocase TatA/TatE family subunit [Thermomicrobiales bacterium]|jgi:sec-independent protein translocase protein TatA|nr:twin-arginine translocase TatA/TatE family subunit [Thermomicrobiales bacterium]